MLSELDHLLIIAGVLAIFAILILLMVCILGPDCPLNKVCPCRYPDSTGRQDDSIKPGKARIKPLTPSFWSQYGSVSDSPAEIATVKERKSEHDMISASMYETYENLKGYLPSDEDKEPKPPPGIVAFTLLSRKEPDTNSESIVVKLKHLDNLYPRAYSGVSHTYMNIALTSQLPKKHAPTTTLDEGKSATKTRDSGKVEFNDSFTFQRPEEVVGENYYIRLTCYEYDKYSRHECIGEIKIALLDVDISEEKSFTQTLIQPKQESSGQLLLSLSYLPTSEKLNVGVVKCRDVSLKNCGDGQIYVKAVILRGKDTLNKKRTKKQEPSSNLTFNETLVFDLPMVYIEKVVLILTLTSRLSSEGKHSQEYIIGKCFLSNECYGAGNAHWVEMSRTPRKAIAYWHNLT